LASKLASEIMVFLDNVTLLELTAQGLQRQNRWEFSTTYIGGFGQAIRSTSDHFGLAAGRPKIEPSQSVFTSADAFVSHRLKLGRRFETDLRLAALALCPRAL